MSLENDYSKVMGNISDICTENGLNYSFEASRYPIVLDIERDMTVQLPLLQDAETENTQKIPHIKFIFGEDFDMETTGEWSITDEIFTKLKRKAQKLHYLYLQIWFKQQYELKHNQ